MAITDDNFNPEELKMLYHFAKERNIEKSELDQILLSPVENCAIPESIEKRIEYLYDLAQMIWADGVVNNDERNTLKKYCRKFEFMDDNIDELSQYILDAVQNGISKEKFLNELNS